MVKPFSLIEYIRRQAGMLAWRALAVCFFGAMAFMGPATLNRVLANSDFAKANSAAIAEATVTAQDASKAVAEAISKADQVIKEQELLKSTTEKLFAELKTQSNSQAQIAQSVAVISEDVKSIQGQLTRDENQIDGRH